MEIKIPIQSLILCLSEAIDLISADVSNHHKLVTCIAYQICDEIGISELDKKDILYACAVHDIGALSNSERLRTLELNYEEDNGHTKRGYLFLKEYEPFRNIAALIRYHHTKWNNAINFNYESNKLLVGANIILLADRIAVLIDKNQNILAQAERITTTIKNIADGVFAKELVEAYFILSKKESFWLDTMTLSLREIFKANNFTEEKYDTANSYQLIKIFSKIIDYRSHFTATHSSGVAASAKALAKIAGFSENDMSLIEIAGFVHDIGKIAVPTEILEKNGALTKEEYNVIRSHTYYTNMILSRIENFNDIRQWASQHHEKMDGTGYPFHIGEKDLSKGSRIMAVADVFVALFEDRPYRKGMQKDAALAIINKMAPAALDKEIVNLLIENYSYINECRIKAQESADIAYSLFET